MKRFEIDTLMLVAAAGAAALGEWAEGALLLFLFSLGHALEHYAMGRAKRAIEALAKLAPSVRPCVAAQDLVEIPVEELALGDIVVVKPNSRLAADGFVVAGNSSIDQAPVTGESIPVDKSAVSDAAAARANPDGIEPVHRVFAGTINGSGGIEIEVTRKSTDSVLSQSRAHGRRGRDAEVADAALHRSIRADLRARRARARRAAAVRLGRGR